MYAGDGRGGEGRRGQQCMCVTIRGDLSNFGHTLFEVLGVTSSMVCYVQD